jgi:uncharacterized membrane protein YkvA (DUF1232 family)
MEQTNEQEKLLNEINTQQFENENFENEYSEESFFSKIKNVFKKAGRAVIEKALILYYISCDKDTPMSAKVAIYSALGYFILPFDVIPDFTPIGFVDDIGAMTVAFNFVRKYYKDNHKEAAKQKADEFFGEQ